MSAETAGMIRGHKGTGPGQVAHRSIGGIPPLPKLRAPMGLTLAAVMAAAIAVPAAAQDEASPSIEGPVWELLSIGETPADTSASMSLDAGTAAIFGGCNSFFGSYTLEGESLTFGDEFTSTLVECEPAVMEQEQATIAALGDVASYATEGDLLDLLDDAGGQVLSFGETSVATVADVDGLSFEIEKTQAHVQQLRRHVNNLDVRGDVKALEPHLNTRTDHHLNPRNNQHQLRQRIPALETQVAQLQELLVVEGIMPLDD